MQKNYVFDILKCTIILIYNTIKSIEIIQPESSLN